MAQFWPRRSLAWRKAFNASSYFRPWSSCIAASTSASTVVPPAAAGGGGGGGGGAAGAGGSGRGGRRCRRWRRRHVEAQLDGGNHRHRLAVDDRWRELPLTRRGDGRSVEQRDRARHLGVAHLALRIDRDLDRHHTLDARPHRFGGV